VAPTATPSLALSRQLLRFLIKLNWLFGLLLVLLLTASMVAEELVMRALGMPTGPGSALAVNSGRLIMVVGIVSVPITNVVLSRLLAIVETVGTGDPFIGANADRLEAIARAVLGLELLHLGVGVVIGVASRAAVPLEMEWSFSITRWLAVLLLFVLARVFEQGALMRDELEGTV
jgi:hypothetical protein